MTYLKLLTLCVIIFYPINGHTKRLFKENKETIKSLSNIYVLSDTTIVEDMPNNKVGLNIEYNLNFGISLFNNLQKYFKNKVPAQLIHSVNSIGLYEQDNVYIPDYRDENNHIVLPLIDKTIKKPIIDNFLIELNPLVDRSHDVSRPTRMHNKYQKKMLEKDFDRIKRLNLNEGDAVMLLVTSGIKVPTKKTVGKAVATTLLTLGLATSIETSAINFNVVLISHDGKLLWAGKSLKTSKSISDKKLLIQLKKLFFGFPIKLEKNKSRH